MGSMKLPEFKYHPDPVATGSVEPSDEDCRSCGQRRGYVYVGPVYSERELDGSLCPWCIADGSAHKKFGCSYSDDRWSGSDAVPRAILEEVTLRTPGFLGWQQEHWLACCNDAAAFVGRAGKAELETRWPDAIPSIRDEMEMKPEEWAEYSAALDKDGSPSAYVFRCLHCAKHLGYSDCD